METCFGSEISGCVLGESSRRMFPGFKIIDPRTHGGAEVVIVLGAHPNMSGVSVLTGRPPAGGGAGGGYPPGL